MRRGAGWAPPEAQQESGSGAGGRYELGHPPGCRSRTEQNQKEVDREKVSMGPSCWSTLLQLQSTHCNPKLPRLPNSEDGAIASCRNTPLQFKPDDGERASCRNTPLQSAHVASQHHSKPSEPRAHTHTLIRATSHATASTPDTRAAIS